MTETIDNAAHVLLLPEEQNFSGLRQRVQEMFPDRQINFTSYNILTIAALVANSDMLAIIPSRFITCLAAAGRWKNCLFRP